MFYICSMPGLHVIWFQCDLRVHDHAALRAACHAATREGEAVLALSILPDSAELSSFEAACLSDLREALAQRNIPLHLRSGDPIEVLSGLHRAHRLLSIYMHTAGSEETRQLEAWCMRGGVALRAYAPFGPAAPQAPNVSWQEAWQTYMAAPRFEAPDPPATMDIGIGRWPDLKVTDDTSGPKGGRKHAIKLLRAYLTSVADTPHMRSGADIYQTLQPYFEFGVVSIREVWQAAMSARQQYAQAGQETRVASVDSLLHRLPERWFAQHQRRNGAAQKPVRTRRKPPSAPGQQLNLGLG